MLFGSWTMKRSGHSVIGAVALAVDVVENE
jgi:hypothetical protein